MESDCYSDSEGSIDQEILVIEQPRISLKALTGIPSHKCMVVADRVGNIKVNILMDSGCTHKIVDET